MSEEKKSNNADQVEESTDAPPKLRYPRSIGFIIGNEFCERFSYYGAKAILVLYFQYVLSFSEDDATVYYHIFAMACYFTPVIGAIIADSLLGKFRTIFYISILYAIGNIILAYASSVPSHWITWLGLAAIALGTGGIKPCVSAFGGDQFGPGQEKQLEQFFSFFYISINAGSLLSTFLTPILREDIPCMGRNDCYPLAFGVPALLMCVALGLFVLGKYVTGYVMVPPKKENVVVQVVSCIFTSLSRKWFKRMPKRDHWLDYADDKYDTQTLADIKAVMRVLFLYLPLPIFWALFDQSGSRWTQQATTMDGNLFGWKLKPDQIQVVNPLLIITMIPLFQYVLYPLLAKFNLLKRPLQRIVTGGILAGVAFGVCGFFQLAIEAKLPPSLNSNSGHFVVVNGMSDTIKVENSLLSIDQSFAKYDHLIRENIKIDDKNKNQLFKVILNKAIDGCGVGSYSATVELSATSGGGVIYIDAGICGQPSKIQLLDFENILLKPKKGGAFVSVIFNIKGYDMSDNKELWFRNEKFDDNYFKPEDKNLDKSFGYITYNEVEVHSGGDYELNLVENKTKLALLADGLELGQGGSYLLIVVTTPQNKFDHKLIEVLIPNSVSMFWQVLYYFIITAGEIMFSITGLEFSYSQAPASMKAVLQAGWLFTVAIGNLLVVIVAAGKIFNKQSLEFFFFAVLMVADMAVFAVMAYFYVPNSGPNAGPTPIDSNEEKSTHLNGKASKDETLALTKKSGVSNDGFQEEDTKF